MKFFTYDLLTSVNNESLTDEQREAAEQQMQQHSILYAREFQRLSNRLPHEIYTRFKGFGFHDYQLEKLELDHGSLFATNIYLTLKNEIEIWKLSFMNISSFHFRHHNLGNKQPIFDPTIDLWVHEEFLSIDEDTLSFEVLFLSGASVQVTFEDRQIKLEKLY